MFVEKTVMDTFAEGSELTPEQRLTILEQTLPITHQVPNTAFRGGNTRTVHGFDDETRERFLKIFAKLPPILSDKVMHKCSVTAALQWLKDREEEEKREEEYRKFFEKRNKK